MVNGEWINTLNNHQTDFHLPDYRSPFTGFFTIHHSPFTIHHSPFTDSRSVEGKDYLQRLLIGIRTFLPVLLPLKHPSLVDKGVIIVWIRLLRLVEHLQGIRELTLL